MARRKQEPEITKELIEPELTKSNGTSSWFRKKVFLDIRRGKRDSNGNRLIVQRGKIYHFFNRIGASIKAFGKKVLTFLKFSFIMKIVNKLKQRSLKTMPNNKSKSEASTETNTKKQSKNKTKWYQNSFVRGIIGIVVALVTVSVAYSIGRVYLGDEDPISRLMITPAALGVLTVIGVAFWKIFK